MATTGTYGRARSLTPLDEQFLRAALDAAERRQDVTDVLASEDAVRAAFLNTWDVLQESLDLEMDAEEALRSVRDLTIYDIPDGTRSTLTVPVDMPVEWDAALYATQFVHTLRSLGAQRAVVMVHTRYNRRRGQEETRRFLDLIARGAETLIAYARERDVQLDLVGMGEQYELYRLLSDSVPTIPSPAFLAHFLLDYEEEFFLEVDGQRTIERLPDIDVTIRHTKLQISGGWIPRRMLSSAYLYSQNGTLASNWRYDEHSIQIAIALLAKELLRGEVLTKSYRTIDEVKERHQRREVGLYHRTITLRPQPRKLFLLSSPFGLVEVRA